MTPDAIHAATERLSGRIRVTPAMAVSGAELGVEGHLQLKFEHQQFSGSFKARGALNTLLTSTIPTSGVVAASGGNHGAAVAWAAKSLGVSATIFVPSIASPAKLDKLRGYGADVRIVGNVFADALEASVEFQNQSHALSIHAYDQASVLAGAGTLGAEFETQVGPLDRVVVACGGGGLAGGLASWFGTGTKLTVVETEGTATFAAALAAGQPTPIEVGGLVADSLGATKLGTAGWGRLTAVGAESVVVSDADVVSAQRSLWDNLRVLVEPAAAAPLAALSQISGLDDESSVGVVLCGGNTEAIAPLAN